MQADWTDDLDGAASLINEATGKGLAVTVNGKTAQRTFAKPPARIVGDSLMVYVKDHEVRQNRVGGSVLWVQQGERLAVEIQAPVPVPYEPADTTDRGPSEFFRGGFGNWQEVGR